MTATQVLSVDLSDLTLPPNKHDYNTLAVTVTGRGSSATKLDELKGMIFQVSCGRVKEHHILSTYRLELPFKFFVELSDDVDIPSLHGKNLVVGEKRVLLEDANRETHRLTLHWVPPTFGATEVRRLVKSFVVDDGDNYLNFHRREKDKDKWDANVEFRDIEKVPHYINIEGVPKYRGTKIMVTVAGRPIACKTCGLFGHWFGNCRQRNAPRSNYLSEETVPELPEGVTIQPYTPSYSGALKGTTTTTTKQPPKQTTTDTSINFVSLGKTQATPARNIITEPTIATNYTDDSDSDTSVSAITVEEKSDSSAGLVETNIQDDNETESTSDDLTPPPGQPPKTTHKRPNESTPDQTPSKRPAHVPTGTPTGRKEHEKTISEEDRDRERDIDGERKKDRDKDKDEDTDKDTTKNSSFNNGDPFGQLT